MFDTLKEKIPTAPVRIKTALIAVSEASVVMVKGLVWDQQDHGQGDQL